MYYYFLGDKHVAETDGTRVYELEKHIPLGTDGGGWWTEGRYKEHELGTLISRAFELGKECGSVYDEVRVRVVVNDD